MAFRNISVLLSANSGNLRPVLTSAARDVQAFTKTTDAAGKSSDLLGKTLAGALAGGAVAVGVALAYSAAKAVAFETNMRNVNSISGLSEAQFRSLGREVLNLSTQLPQSAATLSEGLYDIASSGFQGADGLKVLKASAEAASAGMSTTAVAGKGISAALNAYGLTAADATDVSDILFQTVNLGVVSFEELAGTLGDVVGSAAAAKIPLDQVGSAIAAMTLSGISTAEAGTSLNRVIQSLIQPSDALASTAKNLGINLVQDLANPAKGLEFVMNELRKATGGNIESLLQLFPEIRSARGALALMANEGKNYARVSAGIADADARAGATQKALKEQMKAAGAQFRILRNQADAAAITLGLKVLPVIVDLAKGAQDLAQRAWPAVNRGFAAAQPLFRNIAQIGGDVVKVLGMVAQTAAPVAGALLTIGGAAILTSLTAITDVIAALTGFLADNRELVEAVAAAYLVSLIPALLTSAAAFGALALDKVLIGLYGVAGGADRAAASFSVMGVAAGAATLGIGLMIAAVLKSFRDAETSADNLIKSLGGGPKPNDLAGWEEYRREISSLQMAHDRAAKSSGGWGNALRGALEQVTPMANSVEEARRQTKALEEEHRRASGTIANYNANTKRLAEQTGLSAEEVGKLATSVGADLGKSQRDVIPDAEKVIDAVAKIGRQSGLTSEALTASAGVDIEAWQRLAEAAEATMKKVSGAFAGAVDVIGSFQPTTVVDATQAVIDAQESLADARDRLANANDAASKKDPTPAQLRALARATKEVQAAEKKGGDDLVEAKERLLAAQEAVSDKAPTPAQIRAVARATREVKQAEEAVGKAQKDNISVADQLFQNYEEKVRTASAFADNIRQAIQKGVDPKIVQRLLEAGPEAAAPVLNALVGDHSGRLIRMANESEAKLQEINQRVVMFARLTTQAVNSTTDQLARDLPTAMRIVSEQFAQGGTASAEAIARAIGAPSEEVQRVARAFGIAIAGGINSGVAEGLTMSQILDRALSAVGDGVRGGAPAHFVTKATGGVEAHIATSDTILYGERSTGGEAFIPLGGTSDRSRSIALWRETGARLGVASHAAGHVYPSGYNNGPAAAGQTKVVQVPVPERNVSTIQIGEVRANDFDAALRQINRRKRLSDLVGAG